MRLGPTIEFDPLPLPKAGQMLVCDGVNYRVLQPDEARALLERLYPAAPLDDYLAQLGDA